MPDVLVISFKRELGSSVQKRFRKQNGGALSAAIFDTVMRTSRRQPNGWCLSPESVGHFFRHPNKDNVEMTFSKENASQLDQPETSV